MKPDPSLAAPDFNIYPSGYLLSFSPLHVSLPFLFFAFPVSWPRDLGRLLVNQGHLISCQSLGKNNAHCPDSRLSSQNTLGVRVRRHSRCTSRVVSCISPSLLSQKQKFWLACFLFHITGFSGRRGENWKVRKC